MNRRSVSVRWLPDAGAFHGGFTGGEPRRAPPPARGARSWGPAGAYMDIIGVPPLSPTPTLAGGFFMKRKWWTVCFLSILAGSALHFLYDLWPNPLTAVFAPVNESVWGASEAAILAVSRRRVRADEGRSGRPKSWCGLLAGLLGAPLLLLGAYYTLLSGFALYGLPLDLIFVRAGNGRRLWAGVAFAESGFSRVAVRRTGDCGRRLRCLAGAVFVRAAGSADFHAASLKFSVFLC